MNVLAINGSPRKKWNTATLLEHALKGAKKNGANVELTHLYDLEFKGCKSCFACKKIGGRSYGRCAVKDGLTPLLKRVEEANALILGSPVYFGTESGEMRSFLERLLFPYGTYTPDYQTIFPRRIPTAFIYTMNIREEDIPTYKYEAHFERMQGTMAHILGSCELLLATDTYQFDDYSKYLSTRWDAPAKAKRRAEVFPEDCARAFALGGRLATQAAT